MDREKREQARVNAESLRQARMAQREAARLRQEEQERRIQKALDRSNKKTPVPDEFRPVLRQCSRLEEHLRDKRFAGAMQTLVARGEFLRPVETWKPQGKSAETLFRSLAAHLYAKYPVAPFLWSAFFDNQGGRAVALAHHVAAGGSLFKWMKETAFPAPLTRQMCHEFLKTPATLTFMQGLRRAQVKGLGGSQQLLNAFLQTPWGRELGTVEDEAFWHGVVLWFVNQPMLAPSQVPPLVDFIRHARQQEPGFSMKGRTPAALMRLMEEWHAELAQRNPQRNRWAYKGPEVFKPSGFKGVRVNRDRHDKLGNFHHEVWTVEEIVTASELQAEGRRQGHCVFSYASQVATGQTSIWSMIKEDGTGRWAMLTLEVRNTTRQIVQARGRFNRKAEPTEIEILNRWCGVAGLNLALGSW